MNRLSMSAPATPESAPTPQQVFERFAQPMRSEASDREKMLLAQGRYAAVPYRGLQLASWTWGHGPRVLLMHGWDSRGSHLGALVPALTAAGIQVVAFDAPAHGDSEGRESSVVDFGKAILAVTATLGDVQAVIGHSVGSAAALYAFAHGLAVQASVHIAGPASLVRAVDRFAERAGLPHARVPEFQKLVEQHIGAPLQSMDLDVLRDGMCHPALLLHDPVDREVSYTESVALNAAWPDSSLVSVADVGHRRIIADPGAIGAACEFVVSALRPAR